MAIAPEHYRAARLAIPRLPLPAILGFALFGVGGSVFLAFTTFSHGETKHSFAASNDTPVYEARAVPFDSPREEAAQQTASIAQVLTATEPKVRRETLFEPDRPGHVTGPTLFAESNREVRGFPALPSFSTGSTYLAIAGTSFGMSAQTAPSGFVAPDAESITAPVPETSTWLCGGALFLLVAARGARAHWQRKRRRLR
jgi:hypothetical protein